MEEWYWRSGGTGLHDLCGASGMGGEAGKVGWRIYWWKFC